MRTSFANKELAHVWAHQTQDEGNGSHFYFRGDTIYSYGSHFPIARHYKGAVLFTTDSYSSTTAQHMSITRGAIPEAVPVFYVNDPTKKPSGKDLKRYADKISECLENLKTARNPGPYLNTIRNTVLNGNRFARHFKFARRFVQPKGLEKYNAVLKAYQARRDELARTKQERTNKANAEKVQLWIAGEAVQIPYGVSGTYLRVETPEPDFVSEVVTSRGARVPLADAERAFRFALARKAKGWRRNGEQCAVGGYQIDSIDEKGVKCGCHYFVWDEIIRFATQQNWICQPS